MPPNEKKQPAPFVKWLAGERGSAQIERNPDNGKLQVVKKSRGNVDEGVKIRTGKGRIEETSTESWKRTQQDHWKPRAPQPSTATGRRGGGSATAGYHAPAVNYGKSYEHHGVPAQHYSVPVNHAEVASKRYAHSSHEQAPLLRLHAPNKPPQPIFSADTRDQAHASHTGKHHVPELPRGKSRTPSLVSHISQGSSIMLSEAPAPPLSYISVVSHRSHASSTYLVPVVVEYEPGPGSRVSSHAGGSTRRSHAGTVVDASYDSGYTGSHIEE